MRLPIHLHGPTVRGRLRADRGLLTLTGLVVALTTFLLASVGPLSLRTADEAMGQFVTDAGPSSAVVATVPQGEFRGIRNRDPNSTTKLDNDTTYARSQLPKALGEVVEPGVASLTTRPLPLLDTGALTFLRLAYIRTPDGAPEVSWVDGAAPQSSAGPGQEQVELDYEDPAWPVQVGVSELVAEALDVGPGDRLTGTDEYGEDVVVRVSGVFAAADPEDDAWRPAPQLLRPSIGRTNGIESTTVGALVSPEALPDMRIAVASDQLTYRVDFVPQPERVLYERGPTLRRQVDMLKASPGLSAGEIAWDSLFNRVLETGLAQVSTARGQSQVLLFGLLASALLTLLLAAHLLVRRRAGSLVLSRERGATLPGVAVELAPESLLVAALGTGVGLALASALVGSGDWAAALPVFAGAALAAPVMGAVQAARATDVRRVPANRAARRTAQRARTVRRLVLEAALVALAALSFVGLRQRGALDGDRTTAGAATWWAVAGALVLIRVLPPLTRLALRLARRAAGGVGLFVAARVDQSGTRALPLLVVAVATAQLVFGSTLAATQQHGQEAGALLSVGGDARLTAAPDAGLSDTAADVGAADGVRAAVAALVDDGVRATASKTSADVRLVVVDAGAYGRLLATSDLDDAPQLSRLTGAAEGQPVPALLLGGTDGITDKLAVEAGDDLRVPLDVVGVAPDVGGSLEPVIVVDRSAFEAAGATADPNTIWATGPGAAEALRDVASGRAAVTTYADELSERRDAPLASGLVNLALAAALLLLLLAALGVVLGAAAEAPARATSLGRLRALGLRDRELRRVLAGELLAPVLASMLTGFILGATCAYATLAPLAIEQLTGQTGTPQLVIPWWAIVVALVLPVTALLIAWREGGELRRVSLARMLRSGDTL